MLCPLLPGQPDELTLRSQLCADFNAYYNEQALQNLYDASYTNLEGPNDYSYQFRSATAPFCVPLLCRLEKLHSTANNRVRTG